MARAGEHTQAIGRSRGGRRANIHALTDRSCCPIVFLLTGGQVADCKAGPVLLERMPPCKALHTDRGYDTDAIHRQAEANKALPNIPAKSSRRCKPCFSPALYRTRNAIGRVFCRLEDRRHIATRYDRPVANYGRHLHRRNRQLLVMSLDPRLM